MRVGLVLCLIGCGRLDFDGHVDAPPAPRGCAMAYASYGDQTCALRTDGTVWCWGDGAEGQLGTGTTATSLVPVQAAIDQVAAITSGEDTVCAIRTDGTLWCWGENDVGQVGNATQMNQTLPVPIALPSPVALARGGQYHTCAVLRDGTGYCWGSNADLELGTTSTTMALQPIPAPIGGNLAVVIGDSVVCMIRPDSTAACFGMDAEGELGDGLTTSRANAMPVAIADPIVSISGGCHRHWCAATTPGDVWCWGENMHGEVGTGATSAFEAMPRRVSGVTGAVEVTVGAFHSCARTTAGEIWCWGLNSNGQLGDGSFIDRLTPVRAGALPAAPVELQASCSGTMVRLPDQRLFAWGDAKQLATGATLNQPTPVEVPLPCP